MFQNHGRPHDVEQQRFPARVNVAALEESHVAESTPEQLERRVVEQVDLALVEQTHLEAGQVGAEPERSAGQQPWRTEPTCSGGCVEKRCAVVSGSFELATIDWACAWEWLE